MSTSVVVLSFERPELLETALDSIATQTRPAREVVVVDNSVRMRREVDRVCARHPAFRLVRSGANLGYTGGMNLGLRNVAGEFAFLTEDDIVLDPKCLAAFEEFARRTPDLGLASGIFINRRRRTILSAGGHVRLGRTFEKRVVGADEPDRGQFREPLDVSFIPGAAIFGRLDLLRELGGFREEFFMYMEDLELCLRVRARGRRIVVVPEARIEHWEPPLSTPDAGSTIEVHKIKNLYAVYLLHAPWRVLPEFLARYAGWELVRSLRDRRHFRNVLRACWWALGHGPALVAERLGA